MPFFLEIHYSEVDSAHSKSGRTCAKLYVNEESVEEVGISRRSKESACMHLTVRMII